MSAIASVVDDSLQGLKLNVSELSAAHNVVDAYVGAVSQQLMQCQSRVAELSEVMATSSTSIRVLAQTAAELEVVFSKIDRLQLCMDNVHRLIIELNKTVKAIEAPTDVKERAANFFKSFGLRTKAVEEHSSGKSAWNRVQPYPMIDGAIPADFAASVKAAVEALVVAGGA